MIMKYLFIVIQILIVLLFCSCNSESKVTENPTQTNISENTVINETWIKSETLSESGNNKTLQNELDMLLQALIEKDESELWRIGYIEGKDGFLYNVDFESYKILNSISLQRTDMVEEFIYVVELNISESSDNRFPIGTSFWNIGFSGSGICTFFLPQSVDKNAINEYRNNERANIGRYFTFSFDENNDIQDIRRLEEEVGNDVFEEGVKSFIIGVKPELGNEGEVFVEKHIVDEILNQYFGISDHDLCNENSVLKCDSYRWQSESIYALIDKQSNEYVDIIYYADFAYITPAYKIRYYFDNENNPINLTAVELLEDYGHKPFTQMF